MSLESIELGKKTRKIISLSQVNSPLLGVLQVKNWVLQLATPDSLISTPPQLSHPMKGLNIIEKYANTSSICTSG